MNTAIPLIALAAAAILAVVWALMERRRADGLSSQMFAAAAELATLRERTRGLEDAKGEMKTAFQAASAETLAHTAEALLKRAEEAFASRDKLAQAGLEAQLKPVAETLAKFEAQVGLIEKARAEDTGGLKQQISALMEASVATQGEARKLSAALRRGAGVQGRWGEQTLRNVLEMAGLQNRFDFDEQASTDTEEGRRRPDVVVKMPGGGVLVIDAKCSLNAFLDAQEQVDDVLREAAYARHAESVRMHAKGLSMKAYHTQFETSPDLVAMFVPGDGFLAAALDRQPDLLNEAMRQKVVIVTPTTLFALCKAVAYGWRADDQAANAKQIAEAGRELHKRIGVIAQYAAKLGRSLNDSVDHYNDFVGSLERNVLTQAKRFETLSAHSDKPLAEPSALDARTRPLLKLAVVEDEAEAIPTLTLGKG